ncbi:DUF2090 domain-containing protein [Aliterella atlantica]|uniref:Uncharacterized protein n=1 Tax=Aliterella atlantica CENA595 TaxID=1618023 RepID=A0A0D8ZUM8_9CYAN|nr:DUF2090 domain-containing protein [Aliterella atlantica]KJH72164.1 hypothetical protein UH38_08850 [Aliterella atlantica CENA595]
MLYLALVQKQELSGQTHLNLLAHQQDEYKWEINAEARVLRVPEAIALHEGMLVLVELSSQEEMLSIQDATNWVLDLVKTYLTSGVTPAFLKAESERSEQWRQTLTLQNQELARRSLEVEARREQIQALEESFKRDKENENHV